MNYEVVVAYGRLDIHDYPVWLRSQVGNSPTIMKPGNNTRGPSTMRRNRLWTGSYGPSSASSW